MKACGRTDPHRCTLGAHTQQPVCAHCQSPDVIRGDGGMTLACRPCVAALARIAGDPASANGEVIRRLLDASLDVVTLDVRIRRDPWGPPVVGPAWVWTSSWPGVGDGTRARGGTA